MNEIATTTQAGVRVNNQQHTNPLLMPGIRRIEKHEVFNTVRAAVAKAFADLNSKEISDHDKGYLVNELTDNIISRFPSIRLPEIPIAFANGIRGKFGKYYGLSVVTFEHFIEAHLASEERESFARELPTLLSKNNEAKEPDMLTKFNTAKNNALQALQKKINKQDISLVALATYTFLDGLKLIQFSIEEKYDFINLAREVLVEEAKAKVVTAKDAAERKSFKRRVEKLSSLVGNAIVVDNTERTMIINRSKKLALEAFFENCIMEDTDLDELIESKKDLFMKGGNG